MCYGGTEHSVYYLNTTKECLEGPLVVPMILSVLSAATSLTFCDPKRTTIWYNDMVVLGQVRMSTWTLTRRDV